MFSPATPALSDHHPLLSLAALFDGEFCIDWLEEILGLKPSQILNVLEMAVQENVLVSKSPGIYYFACSEIQEEWQNRLRAEEKERFHKTIAGLLERTLHDTENKVFCMARHLLNVTNDCWGCEWLHRAGMMHISAFHIEEAAQCFTKVINDAIVLTGAEADLLFIKATVEYSNIATARDNIERILSLLQEAMQRAEKCSNKTYQALIEMHIAKNKWLLNSDLNQALQDFGRGLSNAEKMDAPELVATVTVFKTYFLFWQGRFRDVIDFYEKSMPDIERYPLGQFPTNAAITVGRSYAMIGQLTQGLGMLDTVREHCLESGNFYMAARASSAIGSTLLSIRRLEEAIHYLRVSFKEAQKSKNHWIMLISTFMLAVGHYFHGDKERSIAYLRNFLKHSSHSNVNMSVHAGLLEICWAIEQGELPQIEGLSLEKGLQWQLELKNVFIKGIAYRYQALLLRRKGCSIDEIIRSLELSTHFLRQSGNPIELAKSQLELARLYLSAGEEEKGSHFKEVASKVLEPINPALIPDELKPYVEYSSLGEAILEEMGRLGSEASRNNDDKKALRDILISANRIIGSERGALFLVNDNAEAIEFELRASKNFTVEQMKHPNFAPTIKMMEEVVISGRGRILEMNSKETKGDSQMEVIPSRLCVPISLKGKVLGVMYHDNRLLSSAFKKSHLQFLSFLAILIAYKLDNERAHEMIGKLSRKLYKDSFREETQSKRNNFEGIIGKSAAIRNVIARVQKVAGTDASVMIFGETGVGKDLVASAIHQNSPRTEGPFIKVQCNALPESLITSELFGHEKGSFTGASTRRIGRFELADGGTFFLDEIGDLPLEVQVRLLNVLQTKTFERIGGAGKILCSDFRLIGATNRNMEQLILHGQFREDLFYRINIFPIHVPALRERKEDIPLLAEHFLKIYSSRMKKNFLSISPEEMKKLINYDWPGNVRELQHLIERSVILSSGPELRLMDFQPIKEDNAHIGAVLTLKENERRYLLKVLNSTDWKIRGRGGAAELLDIPPSTLVSRMKKLNITRPRNRPGKKRTDPSLLSEG